MAEERKEKEVAPNFPLTVNRPAMEDKNIIILTIELSYGNFTSINVVNKLWHDHMHCDIMIINASIHESADKHSIQ